MVLGALGQEVVEDGRHHEAAHHAESRADVHGHDALLVAGFDEVGDDRAHDEDRFQALAQDDGERAHEDRGTRAGGLGRCRGAVPAAGKSGLDPVGGGFDAVRRCLDALHITQAGGIGNGCGLCGGGDQRALGREDHRVGMKHVDKLIGPLLHGLQAVVLLDGLAQIRESKLHLADAARDAGHGVALKARGLVVAPVGRLGVGVGVIEIALLVQLDRVARDLFDGVRRVVPVPVCDVVCRNVLLPGQGDLLPFRRGRQHDAAHQNKYGECHA